MADGRTPRYGDYDPEADLLDAYGTLPIVATFVDPTPFGQESVNPGFSMAAENPGVPVIMPTSVKTNPNRFLKGNRFRRGDLTLDNYNPMGSAEYRNPMAPNIPEGVSFADEKGLDPALVGAMLGGLAKSPSIPARVSQQRQAAEAVRRAQAASSVGQQQFQTAQEGLEAAQRQLQNVREGKMAGGQLGHSAHSGPSHFRSVRNREYVPDPSGFTDPSDAFYTPARYISGGEEQFKGRLPLGFDLRKPPVDKNAIHELRMGRARLSPRTYTPRSTDGDYRFEEIVTRETPVMVPKPGRDYTPNPYQSEVDFRFGQTKPTRAPVPLGDRPRSSRGYGKQYVQEGAIRGGYDDDVFEAYKAAEELGLAQRQRAAAQRDLLNARVADALKNQQLVGDSIMPGPILATIGGAIAGEVYDETFGEGDTRYMDPSGEQRMAARAQHAKMPASAGRAIRKVLQDRERLSLEPQRNMDFPPEYQPRYMDGVVGLPEQSRGIETSPGLYQELGQELPAVGPLFAFDPYQGY